MASRVRSATQSATQSFSVAHIMLSFAFTMKAANVIEKHEQA
jgi:hypothetical protein